MAIKAVGLEAEEKDNDVDLFELLNRVEMLEGIVSKQHYQLALLEKNAEQTAEIHKTLIRVVEHLQGELTSIEKTKL